MAVIPQEGMPSTGHLKLNTIHFNWQVFHALNKDFKKEVILYIDKSQSQTGTYNPESLANDKLLT